MRKPRQLVEGAWYHITSRVIQREYRLDSAEIRDLFLEYVARAKKRHRFSIANFCIMENHVHLLIQPAKGESLSEIMRWILGYFARAYNLRHGGSGHFWEKRFHSQVLGSFHYLMRAFDYIDANPAKAGLSAQVFAWNHGGARQWLLGTSMLREGAPPWLPFIHGLRPLPTGLPMPYAT